MKEKTHLRPLTADSSRILQLPSNQLTLSRPLVIPFNSRVYEEASFRGTPTGRARAGINCHWFYAEDAG
jgi:hypothetical protein